MPPTRLYCGPSLIIPFIFNKIVARDRKPLFLPRDLHEHEDERHSHHQDFEPVVRSEGFKVIHLFHAHFVPACAGFYTSPTPGATQHPALVRNFARTSAKSSRLAPERLLKDRVTAV